VDQTGKYWPPFYAFDRPVNGAKLVHSAWNHGNRAWDFHISPVIGEKDETFNVPWKPFYAFDYQAPGTEMVHAYWNDGTRSWCFHFPPSPGPGEKDQTGRYWKPFYAYRGSGLESPEVAPVYV